MLGVSQSRESNARRDPTKGIFRSIRLTASHARWGKKTRRSKPATKLHSFLSFFFSLPPTKVNSCWCCRYACSLNCEVRIVAGNEAPEPYSKFTTYRHAMLFFFSSQSVSVLKNCSFHTGTLCFFFSSFFFNQCQS